MRTAPRELVGRAAELCTLRWLAGADQQVLSLWATAEQAAADPAAEWFEVEDGRTGGACGERPTVHGHTVPVALQVCEVHQREAGVDVVAKARVDRHAFGVTALKAIIGRHVGIELAVTLVERS